MPNLKWSQITHLQIGKIAEYYAQIEFLSHGYEVYDTVVDDRGIDFIARKNDKVFEIQVKAVRNFSYTFIAESKMEELTDDRLVCYMNFIDGEMPTLYIIPSTAWNSPNKVLTHKTYDGLKSAPEWGINISQKNQSTIAPYIAENFWQKRSV